MNKNQTVSWFRFQSQTLPVTAKHHKTQIVIPRIILHILQAVRVLPRFLCQSLITGQLVCQPHRTGIETTCPVRGMFQPVLSFFYRTGKAGGIRLILQLFSHIEQLMSGCFHCMVEPFHLISFRSIAGSQESKTSYSQ